MKTTTTILGITGLLVSASSAANPGLKLGLSKTMVDSIVDNAVSIAVQKLIPNGVLVIDKKIEVITIMYVLLLGIYMQ